MSAHQALFLFSVAVVGGALNSVAGGGSFLCFPALVFAGIPPVNANATNTLALWPGTAASTAAYRGELSGYRRLMVPLIVIGMVGGIAGAFLLLHTPQNTFLHMVPWLLLVATLLLTFSKQLSKWIGSQSFNTAGPSVRSIAVAAPVQLVIATYIGCCGAGAGFVILAMFAVMGLRNIHAMNGMKTLLVTICNGVALVAFVLARAIYWPQALLMTCGAALGGYAGAWYAQKLPSQYVRWFAIAVGAGMTVYFFVRTA
jgi:uncharacterized membrane protein YfcA